MTDKFTFPFNCLFGQGCRVSFEIKQSFWADVGITHQLTWFKLQLVNQEGKCLFKAKFKFHFLSVWVMHLEMCMQLILLTFKDIICFIIWKTQNIYWIYMCLKQEWLLNVFALCVCVCLSVWTCVCWIDGPSE